ncbi:MAG: hypothetical protein WBN68_00880 [Sedimenticolaceae bacterium]
MAELLKTARTGDPLTAVTEPALQAAIPCDAGGKRYLLGDRGLETTA